MREISPQSNPISDPIFRAADGLERRLTCALASANLRFLSFFLSPSANRRGIFRGIEGRCLARRSASLRSISKAGTEPFHVYLHDRFSSRATRSSFLRARTLPRVNSAPYRAWFLSPTAKVGIFEGRRNGSHLRRKLRPCRYLGFLIQPRVVCM